MKTCVAIAITILLQTDLAYSQANSNPWPTLGRVGIGTQIPTTLGPDDLLHIRGVDWTFMSSDQYTHPALRLSLTEYASGLPDPYAGPTHFGQLAMENNEHYSAISQKFDLVMRASPSAGDLFLADGNYNASIRMTTTPDPTTYPLVGGPFPYPPHFPGPFLCPWGWGDQERFTINRDGNIGIDIAPDATGHCYPQEQVQIGGGVVPWGQYSLPIPGLTIYGGNKFEGMQKPGGGFYPVDWRSISFNHVTEHVVGSGGGGHRFQNMPTSGIAFSEVAGGLLHFGCSPAVTDVDPQREVVVEVTGQKGMEMWSDESSTGGDRYHHLFDVWRPGMGGWRNLTNQVGLFFHHTPVYIGGQDDGADVYNLPFHPSLGDPWMLAVNGAALAKEFFVRTDWPDFVFEPSYNLRSLKDVETYILKNKHLPDVSSADEIAQTGVALGKTEAKLLQKIEELTLYTIELNKQLSSVSQKLRDLETKIEHQ